MSLRQRLMRPRFGERVEVYKDGRLLIRGLVTSADDNLICINGEHMNVMNFRPEELDKAIANREMRIKKL